jgi:hypothetical protein
MHGESGLTVPDVGDIVHYRSRGSADSKFPPACIAAIVTVYHGTTGRPSERAPVASLAVLNPAGLFFQAESPQDETRSEGGTWHWTHRSDR